MYEDAFSPRQLGALLWTALSAPLAIVCARTGWVWALAAALAAGLFYACITGMCRPIPRALGYGGMLTGAWGTWLGRFLAAANWAWLLIAAAGAARMAEAAFPDDRAFPLIPLVLLAIAATVAAKPAAAAARFGGLLFLFVAALLGATLVFGAADVKMENLIPFPISGAPGGDLSELAGPLCVLLTPAAALFLRDGLDGQRSRWVHWYLLLAALAAALSLVCTGALGLPLARASANPFWQVSRSISVFGVMERFEALISALLALGFCCLLALLLCAAGRAGETAVPVLKAPVFVWGTAAICAGGLYFVPLLPGTVWLGGNLIFWVLLPLLTLGIVARKSLKKVEKTP